MADLPDKLNQNDKMSLNANVKINSLLWADDILILSETEARLNSSSNNLHEYCEFNELPVKQNA